MSYDINLKRLPKGLSAAERFAYSYSPEALTGCWLWTGTLRGGNSYGTLKVNGRPQGAHRFSYALHRGPIPSGSLVLHQCDTPSCVNPQHLFLGTNLDNVADKVAKGRQSRGERHRMALAGATLRGAANGNSRLSAEQATAIRALSLPQRQIASMFGVSQALVSKIQRGEMWK